MQESRIMNRVENQDSQWTVDLLLNSTVFKYKFLHDIKFDNISVWFFDNIFKFLLLLPSSMLKLPLIAEQESTPLIRSSRCYIQMWLLINYIIIYIYWNFPYQEHTSLVICVSVPRKHLSLVLCSVAWETNITNDVHFQLFFPDQMPQIGSRLLISSLDLVGDYLQHCKCGTFYLF